RWSQSLGSWDFALSRFRGTARAPRMVVAGPSLTPVYDLIDQTGLELQYTSGDWLFKLEAMSRSGQGPQFRAAVGGVEWTLPGTFGSNADLGLLVEYNRDTRDPALAPATFYDDDVFVGARLALNDIGDSSLLAGALIDRNTPTRVLFIEGQRRFGDSWVLGLKGRFFTGAALPDPIAAVNSDDFLTLTLKRSF
ncbi:MAG: hypothetical protein GXP05_14450, partial [Alphaproteobacteria bacterium]|nr:hypothetical protein [Alphaproteobacteria bacterium]